jgi:glucosamine--fructose-6-phosphate aminotransferase (isomerizing)
MCGIVGGVSERDVVPILMEGLRRLEYRGYDSAGIAVMDSQKTIKRLRGEGKVSILQDLLTKEPIHGKTGIAHTRWATHGVPSERNAHPHIAANIVLVHNGIVENYRILRDDLMEVGHQFNSDTDSEVVACLIAEIMKTEDDLLEAVKKTVSKLEGAYAIGVMDIRDPNRLVGVRSGPPLVVGLGIGEHFLASDTLALQRVTDQFMYLEEGDIAEISRSQVRVFDKTGNEASRQIYKRTFSKDAVEKGAYRHFMLKEIYEQPKAIINTLENRIHKGQVQERIFGAKAPEVFDKTKRIQIIACGTSYHAALIAKLWLESIANIPCQVEIASEFRYRKRVTEKDTLIVSISQSGETADTLAALRCIDRAFYTGSLSICNVPDSSLVRESDLVFLTNAGPEIGVCSTKAFTAQLVALFLFTLCIGRRFGIRSDVEKSLIASLETLPMLIEETLVTADRIKKLARVFEDKHHTLFLGRGFQFPIALEGALKLKEISYIHAEAYPAGELKHGPLALVDKDMPVVVVAPNDALLDKLKSNIQEVRARGGYMVVFAPKSSGIEPMEGIEVIDIPEVPEVLAPIVYTVPLQLLSYYVAVLKGTDVDQPRNLAKSVTVE